MGKIESTGKCVSKLLYLMVPYWGDKYHLKECKKESDSPFLAFHKYGFFAVKYGLTGACTLWELLD